MNSNGLRPRLVAILAADVAGYSRLMAGDDRATVAALDAARGVFRVQIDAHQGRVVDMAGDSVLAVFDTAIGAVSAAQAIQNEIDRSACLVPEARRMRFRIGVHLGDVIEKDDGSVYGDGVNIAARLESLAEPGGVAVSASVHAAVKGKVASTFEDRGEQRVKNIADPVRLYHSQWSTAVPTTVREPVGPRVLSIVVLPFDNLGDDLEQGYLADAITEDLTTDLSRISGSFVISRSTAFSYKGRTVDIKQVGIELGVAYVLEGSIRRAGNRIRINAQLIETRGGAHIWADRFDRDLGDLLALQDDVTGSIARTLRYELVEAESRRGLRERAENPLAIDCVLRARATLWRDPMYTRENVREARSLYEAALALDPSNLLALQGLAGNWLTEVVHGWSDDPPGMLDAVEALLLRAEAVKANDPSVLMLRGMLLMERHHPEQALDFLQAANARDPNSPSILTQLGRCCLFLADPEAAITHVEGALRRDPRGFNRGNRRGLLGTSKLYLGRYDESIAELERCCREVPTIAFFRYMLAAACAMAGRMVEANESLHEFRRLRPGVGITGLRAEVMSSHPRYLQMRETVFTGLRLAGLED